jgi:branched-chain amino acid transport system ATP-binding protein
MLVVRGLSRAFGGPKAVDAVDIDVPQGAIVGLIGPNGAGKTTCIAELGMVRTFQITQPFARLSVRENVMVGAYLRHPRRAEALRAAERVAARVGMGGMLDMRAGDLTVAGRKRLELARALATEPRLLLLDEVTAGLNPTEIDEIVGIVRDIRADGITILMIEHVMQAVMCLAARIHVLDQGRIIARGAPAARIVEVGLVQVPEGRRVFPNLSVRENLELGSYRRGRANRARDLERVVAIFPRLAERAGQAAGTLSGGEQQMLAIGRGLMTEPRLLVLDEPSLGLSPLLVEEMFALIRRLNANGLAILLVEQNVVQSLAIARRAYVLEHGRMALSGPAAELAGDPALRRSYLGL